MDLTMLAVVGICVMLALLMLGMNVGMAMMIVGFFGFGLARNFDAAFGMLRTTPFTIATNYTFVVIPLFILMGNAIFKSGLSDGLFDAVNKWLSRLPRTLALPSIGRYY